MIIEFWRNQHLWINGQKRDTNVSYLLKRSHVEWPSLAIRHQKCKLILLYNNRKKTIFSFFLWPPGPILQIYGPIEDINLSSICSLRYAYTAQFCNFFASVWFWMEFPMLHCLWIVYQQVKPWNIDETNFMADFGILLCPIFSFFGTRTHLVSQNWAKILEMGDIFEYFPTL